MFTFLENVSARLSLLCRHSLDSFIDLETCQDDRTLVTGEGALVSLIRVDGYRGLLGQEEFSSLLTRLTQGLSPSLEKEGYGLQIWYNREECTDPDRLRDAQRGVRHGARTLGLDMDDIFEAQLEKLAPHSLFDQCYLALWTKPEALSKEERAKNRKERFKAPWVTAPRAQELRLCLKDLPTLHHSFVDGMLSLFETSHLRSACLSVHDALRVIRESLYPGRDFQGWRASLPGDPLRPRLGALQKEDYSELLWSSLKSQLCDEPAEEISRNRVRLGDRLWGSVDVTLAPSEPQPLSALTSVLSRAGVPFRLSMMMEAPPWRLLHVKEMMAKLLDMTNKGENRLIAQAIEAARMYARQETYVALRLSFSTWAPESDPELLERRVSLLARAIEGWGGCQITRESGDPLEAFVSSVLGISCQGTAPRAILPLREALKMASLQRDASPFDQGSSLLLTVEGAPWMYDGRSSELSRTIEIFVGAPRSGKSVKANESILREILSSSSSVLPYVGIIDIGLSSSGAISLLKEALPEDKKSLVGFFTLKMDAASSINPLDTPLGCRKPLPQGREFVANFILTLLTPVGKEDLSSEISDLVTHIVDALYHQVSDQEKGSRPKRYAFGRDETVDTILKTSGIVLPPEPLWWEVTDALFQAGEYVAAKRAQRYAVPTLSDAASVVRDSRIMDIFKNTRKGQSQETVIEAFERMISSVLKEYPNLSQPTQFDLQGARICALDLGEVAPAGTGHAQKQSAIMYMLARHTLVQDWAIGEEVLREAPVFYRAYYKNILKNQRAVPKTLFIDEYHRTGGLESFRNQIIRDALEGQKWGLKLMLSSQDLSHFDEEIIRIATALWIMDVGSKEDYISDISTKLGLSSSAQTIARHQLTGPSEKGTPLLLRLYTKRGDETHFLKFVISPLELWALSTTAEDVTLRQILYDRIGSQQARRILAQEYPEGTIRKELERRKKQASGQMNDEDPASWLDTIAGELLQKSVKSFLILMVTSALCSCSLWESDPASSHQAWFEATLSRAVEKAAHAQEQLARLEQVRTPRISSQWVDFKDVPPKLRKPLSLNWQGPLEPVVRKIAEKINYKVVVIGKLPVISPVISCDVQAKPAVLLLREIGHQARGKADLHIHPLSKTIEVRYAPRR